MIPSEVAAAAAAAAAAKEEEEEVTCELLVRETDDTPAEESESRLSLDEKLPFLTKRRGDAPERWLSSSAALPKVALSKGEPA